MIRVEARSRLDRGTVWLDVGRPNVAALQVQSPARVHHDGNWQREVLEADIPIDATSLDFGGFAVGRGTVWFDDFELVIVEGGEPRVIGPENSGFEARRLAPWTTDAGGFSIEVGRGASGRALRIERMFVQARGALFEPRPEPNEILDLQLGAGLRVQLPIPLPEVFARQSIGQPPAATRAPHCNPQAHPGSPRARIVGYHRRVTPRGRPFEMLMPSSGGAHRSSSALLGFRRARGRDAAARLLHAALLGATLLGAAEARADIIPEPRRPDDSLLLHRHQVNA